MTNTAVKNKPFTNQSGKEVIRTPDERFENLEGYPFTANYIEIDDLRIHYVDEGPADAEPVLLLHGEPSWSYLYRKMIPIIADAGYRVIAPDLIGFGKSDKFVKENEYSHQFHVDIITRFIEELDLNNITMFCQDWGGLIGLRIAVDENQEPRFARIIAANTSIPGRPPKSKKLPLSSLIIPFTKTLAGFGAWYTFSQLAPELKMGMLINMGTAQPLSKGARRAYDAPYPDKTYKAGPNVFPRLVPSQPKENAEAWEKLTHWEKPFLTAFGVKDPILGALDILFQKLVPGAQGINHQDIQNASHFLQEDKGEELAELTVKFIQNNNV